jgi:hypothetical protein
VLALLPRTIRARAFLGSVLAVLVAFIVIGAAVPAIARDHEVDVLGARLASDATLAADLARDGFRAASPAVLDPLAHRIAGDAQIRVTFIGTDGTVLGESDEDRTLMENHATRPEVIPALEGREGRAIRQSATLGRDLLYVAEPVRDGDRVIGVSRVALPLVAVDALAARLVAPLIAGAAAAAVVALALSYLEDDASDEPREGRVARYARGRDYHGVMKRKLKDLVARLREHVKFEGRKVLYTWIGGTRRDWRGQGHFRALTEEQEVWALANGFDEIIVKTKNRFYEMRSTLAQLHFDLIRFVQHPYEPAESKLFFSKRLGQHVIDRHRSRRSVVRTD